MHARRILLIGGTGQLGAEIRGDADTFGFEVQSPDSKSLDITDDELSESGDRRIQTGRGHQHRRLSRGGGLE